MSLGRNLFLVSCEGRLDCCFHNIIYFKIDAALPNKKTGNWNGEDTTTIGAGEISVGAISATVVTGRNTVDLPKPFPTFDISPIDFDKGKERR